MEDLFPIPNLPKYLISRCGNVFSEINGIYLNPNFRNKYLVVSVKQSGRKKTISIHRIVAETFIPNPENKPCVNHINGVRTDNRVENLEWCTIKENIHHAIKNKLSSQNSRPVLDTSTGITYPSVVKAASVCGISQSTLIKRLKGRMINNTSMIYLTPKQLTNAHRPDTIPKDI